MNIWNNQVEWKLKSYCFWSQSQNSDLLLRVVTCCVSPVRASQTCSGQGAMLCFYILSVPLHKCGYGYWTGTSSSKCLLTLSCALCYLFALNRTSWILKERNNTVHRKASLSMHLAQGYCTECSSSFLMKYQFRIWTSSVSSKYYSTQDLSCYHHRIYNRIPWSSLNYFF